MNSSLNFLREVIQSIFEDCIDIFKYFLQIINDVITSSVKAFKEIISVPEVMMGLVYFIALILLMSNL